MTNLGAALSGLGGWAWKVAFSAIVSMAWPQGSCCLGPLPQAADAEAKQRAAEFYRRGGKLFLERQFERAIPDLKRSLELDPQQARATELLGLSYFFLNRTEEAEETFRQACRLDPDDSEAWLFLGIVYYRKDFFAQALQSLETALRRNPKDFRIHEYLARTLEATGATDSALKEYSEAVRWNGEQQGRASTPHLYFGMFLYKLNRLEESEHQLRVSADLNPGDWRAHFELGKLYYHLGKLEASTQELKAALHMGTASSEEAARVYRLLGRVYYQAGREEDARNAIAMAENSKP